MKCYDYFLLFLLCLFTPTYDVYPKILNTNLLSNDHILSGDSFSLLIFFFLTVTII